MYCKDSIIIVIISFFFKTFFFTLQWANHGTMSISYDVTSCAQLKCIVSCLNFGFEDIFIDGECADTYETRSEYNLFRHVFFQ